MKKLRRAAAILLALLLGTTAWLTVMLSARTEGELRLARELSTGRLLARVAPPKSFVSFIDFGPPHLAGRYLQRGEGSFLPLRPGVIFVHASPRGRDQVWYVNLDPLDKRWEIEIVESRPVYLRIGRRSWRLGTKARVWRTDRGSAESD